ncbi:MAG: serine hydrolase, partial [Candidatus Magasanikbacteria bacterium]|nr:serine hydrolase [Candidatus Magasanikbacteria bacterium]
GSTISWPLASITKLMTALVLSDMDLNWNASVKLSGVDEVGGARLRVAVGGVYRRIDLLHASLMGSANNATNALARTSGLTKQEFVARKNAKAKQLGMLHTHFTDPTGIRTTNVSTAYDISLLIEAAAKDARILPIEQKKTYTLRSIAKKPRVHTIKNTDSLLQRGVDVQVAKTGYLVESKYNFAVKASDAAGNECTVVVLGAPSMARSIQLASKFGNLE